MRPCQRDDLPASLPAARRIHRALRRNLPGEVIDLDPKATGARDFADTADLVAGLDLVVAVDTAVAHLAGAMGKPGFVLLPAVDTDWRWLRDRTDSPWYPSLRLFRQAEPGAWDPVVDAVAEAAAALAGAPDRAGPASRRPLRCA